VEPAAEGLGRARRLQRIPGMTPKSPRSPIVAAEVRVPTLGTAFGALAASVRPEGVHLSTFNDLALGTSVVVELALPDGPAIVDGLVIAANDPHGRGLAVELQPVDDRMRMRLSATSSMLPPMAKVA